MPGRMMAAARFARRHGGRAASLLAMLHKKGGVPGMKKHHRGRGITSRDMRVTRKTMRKIIKMYNSLPHRVSHAGSRGGRFGRK